MEWGAREHFLIALVCAEAALPSWEQAHPNDKRPQLATTAARAWLQNPTDATSKAANIASAAAGEAADETDDMATAAAACAASWAAWAAQADTGAATWAAGYATRVAARAGATEPEILRAFAREVAGTPLEPLITAELL